MLAYGGAADTIDEYLNMARSITLESLEIFCIGIIECFGPVYNRRPTVDDTQCLLAKGKERGFPGMLGSLDCMH